VVRRIGDQPVGHTDENGAGLECFRASFAIAARWSKEKIKVVKRQLHLGCGKAYLPGWINVDIFSTVKADAYHDVTALPFERDSFDTVYASHILEHVHRHMVLATLNHWVSFLKPGGVLRLAVPNFGAVAERYVMTRNLTELIGLLYGGQNCHLNRHTIAFDHDTLADYMTKAKLENVRVWKWQETEHAAYDDYSQSFLPHMDKQHGMLMSLNLEGTK
jgi:predicted SAM-dependent methyltransferase